MASQQQSGPLSDADIYALQEWIAETAQLTLTRTRHGGDATKKARLVLLTVIIFMFINSTSLVILDLEYILVQIPLGSFNPPDIQKTTKILGNIKISVCNVFDAASGAVNVLKNYQAVGAGTKEFLVLTLPLLVTNIVATFLIGYKAL
ncbi:hypothetical protein HHX47_DHR1002037 [Lentinula edodes]|nr:hypothetical protein HHX47_DHR1002037 [Lentinula edodes]